MLNETNVVTQTDEKRVRRLTVVALIMIVLLGAFFRFYQLGSSGVGNDYYAATVKSMLTSWHNFFFVSYEPGGSVSVDKPPLGFWLEAASAKVFGLNGFALAFPNALAGVLSIPLLYYLVRKSFGRVPGLIAALVLACIPVTVAAERNNTIDGMLVFTLLLATCAFFRSVETGKLRHLLLGAVVVGLAFNIKMLQAYMVVPGLYLLYLLGARHGWWKRVYHLALATVVLLVVSLAWVVIVDVTPASDRPYVGSSTDNTMMELIIGHNGVERLSRGLVAMGDDRPSQSGGSMQNGLGGPRMGMPGGNQNGAAPSGNPPTGMDFPGGDPGSGNRPEFGDRPNSEGLPGGPGGQMTGQPGGAPPQGQDGTGMGPGGGGDETGKAGILRLFNRSLAPQCSWLLPFVLILFVGFAVLGRRMKAARAQWLGLLLWSGWLIPMVIYFSFTSGLWHTYYLIMPGPGIAGLMGASFWLFSRIRAQHGIAAGTALTVLSGATIAFQIYAVSAYPAYFKFFAILLIASWAVVILTYWIKPREQSMALVFLVLTIAPLLWSGLTAVNPNADTNLPRAEPVTDLTGDSRPVNRKPSANQQAVLDYLLKNTDEGSYLVAGQSARETSSFILSTDRPVLAFGGFGGGDNVVDVTRLQEMVSSGKLRFVLGGGNEQGGKSELFTWVKNNCRVVPESEISGESGTDTGNQPFGPRSSTLYDCMPAG
jgi:4-amino-4-deoxy-L-arabinose transferase-like glycosyltransferase